MLDTSPVQTRPNTSQLSLPFDGSLLVSGFKPTVGFLLRQATLAGFIEVVRTVAAHPDAVTVDDAIAAAMRIVDETPWDCRVSR
jgi:hypothetical protein